jgi:hypothetical protein
LGGQLAEAAAKDDRMLGELKEALAKVSLPRRLLAFSTSPADGCNPHPPDLVLMPPPPPSLVSSHWPGSHAPGRALTRWLGKGGKERLSCGFPLTHGLHGRGWKPGTLACSSPPA